MADRRAEDLSFEEIKELIGRPDPLVLEVGANNGHHTRMFLGDFPRITIHCFEPDQRAIRRWKDLVRDRRATLHVMAIGATTGKATFNMSDGREAEYEGGYYGAGSLRRPVNEAHPWLRFDRTIEVDVERLDDWAERNVPGQIIDFIWADIQGAEVDLIKGGFEALRRTRWLYTEFNDNESYVGQIPLSEIANLLAADFEIECIFPGDVLLRNKHLEPRSPDLMSRGTRLEPGSKPISIRYASGDSYRAGEDGTFVKIPGGYTYRQGKDGRIVPMLNGSTFRQGSDGRIVVVPEGHTYSQGSDGRIVTIGENHFLIEGEDGRLVGVAPGDRVAQDPRGRLRVVNADIQRVERLKVESK